MTLENLIIDSNATLHNSKTDSGLIAVAIKEYYEYDGSKRTDKIQGYAVEVVDSFNRFEKSVIKLPGLSQKPFEIQDEYLSVYFKGLNIKPYVDYSSNTVKFSITANDVEVLEQ